MDVLALRKALRTLQATQDEIPKLSRAITTAGSAEASLNIMVEEAVANSSKRLLIFYLFNDIVQNAARKRQTEFLEAGSGIFLHGFGPLIHRLPLTERKSYIRTVDIWKDRHVYSENFCARLVADWSSVAKDGDSSPKKKIDMSETLKSLDKAEAAVEEAKRRYKEVQALTCHGDLPISLSAAATLATALEALEAQLALELQQVGVACIRFADLTET